MVTARTPAVKKPSATKKVADSAATTKKTTVSTTTRKAAASTTKAAPKARAKAPSATVSKTKPTTPKQEKLTLDVVATSKPKAAPKIAAKKTVSPEERYKMIAAAAYFQAERHGFTSGRSLDDWIAAEKEIDSMLNS